MQSCRNKVFSYISKHSYNNKTRVTAQWVLNNKNYIQKTNFYVYSNALFITKVTKLFSYKTK